MHNLPIERTLIVAPHPDDEAIGAGGLIQRILSAGGNVHVAFVTDGENNAWPQRYLEKRWRIGPADRARWGSMRRIESAAALQTLGVPAGSTTCLAFPDQKIAALERAGDTRLRSAIVDAIRLIRPTLVVSPSTFDAHEDHRATCRALHAAVAQIKAAGEPVPAITTYVVHGNCPASRVTAYLALSAAERERKRAAIEQHTSQLLLSRKRFLSYAGDSESFYRDEFDLVRTESRLHSLACSIRHAALVLLGTPKRPAPRDELIAPSETPRHV